MLKKELLEIICCPVCRGELKYSPELNLLSCTSCSKTYEVKDDIPILLPDTDGK